ncbi:LysR family transcriptional regulator [Caproiciproducens faecalis]|uniref:LysR family transcriptional regulator n=1 Tax=Caproiciproducens faecalis TaxID=2820301 RepID=A0ABS7DPR0_9FIRM|nr:LysR family transcriptional regulator [Caproiciproducens faecalis]MBW7573280.1 LysR family transcriptional regulator [Caproiciproducens faecalis]
MDLKRLEYFVAICEEGSISAAAKKLHISQPPLSHQLQLLETELGVKLVERGARHITLTDAGVILYKRAGNILELADAAARELGEYGEKMKGTLRLGATSSSFLPLLDPRITEYTKLYPEVNFELHEGNTFQMIELLAGGVIEIAVIRTPFHAENTAWYSLNKEPMIAVGDQKYFYNTENSCIRLEDLKNKPLIIYRRYEKLILSAFRAAGFRPDVFCLNDDSRTTLMWANAGLGVAVVPYSMESFYRSPSCLCKTIDSPLMETQITAIWRSDRALSSVAKSFLAVFKRPS